MRGLQKWQYLTLKEECKERPLTLENASKLNFISTNGPHPLLSLPLVENMLDSHFGNKWHFILNDSKWFVSKTIDRHFTQARELPNSLV